MIALAHSHRKITVESLDKNDLLAERSELLLEVGYETSEDLFQHIESESYTERERIVAERLEAILWLLGREG